MNGRERGKLLREQVLAAYEAKAEDRRPNRIRPSELGHECARYLWYRFRWADEFETFQGRMHRLFQTGHIQEDRLLNDLRMVGAQVYARDPDNAKEQIGCELLNGHMKGFLDGVASNVPFAVAEWVVAECKSHNDKSFKALEREGVAIAKPQHYAQMQLYMREHQIDEALYLAVNKNDDDLYFEFVAHDKRYSDALVSKAEAVIALSSAPTRVNSSPAYFKCKMCSAFRVCHMGDLPSRSCRTCMFVTPVLNGANQGWHCGLHGIDLNLDQQKAGCESHRFHPHMIKGKNTEERVLANDEVPSYVYVDDNGEVYEDAGPSGDKAVNSKAAAQ